MRKIGTINSQEQAEKFNLVLESYAIQNQIEEEDGSFLIWVHDEEQLEIAKQHLEQFLENPEDSRYQHATVFANRLKKQQQKKEKRTRQQQVNMSQRWNYDSNRPTPITWGLIAISLIVSFGFNFSRGDGHRKAIEAVYISKVDFQSNGMEQVRLRFMRGLPEIRKGQVWRLITPAFLHLGEFHLLFNMIWLYQLGRLMEQKRGSWRILFLVFILAIFSNYGQYLWSGPAFGGMSGVVYGLFGYIWIRGKYDLNSGFILEESTVVIMLVWFFICFTGFMPIANTAHTVGLLIGMATGAYKPLLNLFR